MVGKQRALRCTVIPQEPRAFFAGVQPLSPRAACSPPRPPRTPGRGLVPVARALAACYFPLWVSFYFSSGVGLSPGRLGCRLWHVLPLQKTSLNATHRVSEQPPERGNQTVSKAVAGTGALRGRRGGRGAGVGVEAGGGGRGTGQVTDVARSGAPRQAAGREEWRPGWGGRAGREQLWSPPGRGRPPRGACGT